MDILPFEVEKERHKKSDKVVRRRREDTNDFDVENEQQIILVTGVKPKMVKPESKKLRKKLQEFEEQNQTLAKTISDKNLEINALKRSVDSLNDVLNSVPIDELRCNSSIASSKILELSKKNRQLRAELEQLKNRVNKKDMHIEKLARELSAQEEKLQVNTELIRKSNAADELQTKITSMQQKLFETRNKNVELQNQLKLAQKCLQHETGENVNINLLAANLNQANWRGRAQQILALQQKVQELKARVDSYEDHMSDRADYVPVALGSDVDLFNVKPLSSRSSVPAGPGGDTAGGTFDRFTPGVRKSEILHKAKVEALEKEIAGLHTMLDEQRNKTLALKVRNKTLHEEMNKYKLRSNELEEQTDYNGVNITTMNEKLNRQRHQYESRLDDMRNDLARITEERDTRKRQMDELSSMNLELETNLKQKEAIVDTLQDMVKKLETDLRAVTGGFLFACREFRKEEFVSILDSLEVEKNQLALMNKTLNERLEAERVKNEAAAEQIAKHKSRINRLDTKIRELEKELDTQTERKKRTQRMADYANSLSRTSLNGSISSFCFDNQSQYQSTGTLNSAAEPKIEDLKNSLELANEKITMLTEKLDYLTVEKQNDAKFFEETILNTKNIILETICSTRQIVPNPLLSEPRSSDTAMQK